MCGLFGWQLSQEALKELELHTLAAVLAFNAERRGDDSWGAAMYSGDAPEILKDAGSIKKTCKIRRILAPQVIGHTRKATTGAVTAANAHPFHIGNIIGAHNGFVFGHEAMNKQYNRDFQVDSQHLIAHIAEERDLRTLDGSGTVSYLDTNDPGTVMLGRGSNSDLTVYGIGTHSKPLGVVWGSVSLWVTEALEMSGIKEYFMYSTSVSRRYQVRNGELLEAGDFPFSSGGRVRTWVPGKGCWEETTRYGSDSGCKQGTSSYDAGYGAIKWADDNDRKYWENYRAEKKGSSLINITRDDLDHLPPALKKNPEVGGLATGESKKATETLTQCDGCRRWGATVDDYEDNARGIVHFPQCDEYLCFSCAAFWGSETGNTLNQLAVPTLKLNLDEKLLK